MRVSDFLFSIASEIARPPSNFISLWLNNNSLIAQVIKSYELIITQVIRLKINNNTSN